jgi:hypothetical protein
MLIFTAVVLGIAGGVAPTTGGISEQDELLSLLEEGHITGAEDSNSLYSEVTASVTDFKRLRQELILKQMQPLEQQTEQQKTARLNELIRQLRSLDMPAAKLEAKADRTDESEPDTQSAAQQQFLVTVSSHSQIESDVEARGQDDNLFEKLKNAAQAPHPMKVADTLYRQKYYTQALAYYETIYPTLSEDRVTERQWALFQMANCCRTTDTDRAGKLYAEFIQLYPSSEWTSIAHAQKELLEWNQMIRIQELINKDVNVARKL